MRSVERAALGAALADGVTDIVGRLHALALESGPGRDRAVEAAFDESARVATLALAEWISGDDTRQRDFAAAECFAQLAKHPDTSLNEITERCLRWRDCVAAAVLDEAERLEASRTSVREALMLILESFDITLVRVCEVYDVERQLMVAELDRRRQRTDSAPRG